MAGPKLTKYTVKVKGKFVSRKINTICWRPEKNSKLGIPVETFACGSYDDPVRITLKIFNKCHDGNRYALCMYDSMIGMM
jgi:hypothetical protein